MFDDAVPPAFQFHDAYVPPLSFVPTFELGNVKPPESKEVK